MTRIPLWMKLLRWYALHSPVVRGTYRVATMLYPRLAIPNSEVVTTLDGDLQITLRLPNWVDFNMYCLGFYERPLAHYFLGALTARSVVLDVGAYIGQYTLLAARHAPQGHVVAFEPHPESYQRLEAHVARNKLTNVRILQQAAGAQAGHMSFALARTASCSGLLPPGSAAPHVAEVAVTTIDQVVQQLNVPRVDLIKIDVEGAVGQVLHGAQATLTRDHPLLIVEVSRELERDVDDTPEAIFALLRQLQYKCYCLRWRGVVSMLVPIQEASVRHENIIAIPTVT